MTFYNIPDYTRESLEAYVIKHREPSGFLFAVLTNDLRDAVAMADDANGPALTEIVRYCRWEIPGDCWGSKAKVAAWLEATP